MSTPALDPMFNAYNTGAGEQTVGGRVLFGEGYSNQDCQALRQRVDQFFLRHKRLHHSEHECFH
jgi:hypothetical protein